MSGDLVQEQPLQCRHELVVAFQRGVQFGAVDDHAGLLIKAHLLERERAADHVASEALAAFGIGGLGTDAIVYRESGVTPLAHAIGQTRIQHALSAEKIEHLVTQRFTEFRLGQRG